MSAKQVLLSTDDITYYLLPGSTGSIAVNGKTIDDTIFGQNYKSTLIGSLGWTISANAIYKGYPGYVATIKKIGATTTMTGEAMTTTGMPAHSYQIVNTAKRIWDRSITFVVHDGATDVTANVASIDYLFGIVTFLSTYTVLGAVTVTGNYFPTANIGKFQSYTLTQSAAAIDDSDMPTLNSNGGYQTYAAGLQTVSISLPSVFDTTSGWQTALVARTEYVIEINPDGTGDSGSLCRGFFRLTTDSRSGAVGALELETITFELSVPLGSQGNIAVATPFSWQHGASSPIPTAIKEVLTQYLAGNTIFVKYLYDGVNGWKGTAVITDASLAGGMDTANEVTLTFQGSGAPTAQP